MNSGPVVGEGPITSTFATREATRARLPLPMLPLVETALIIVGLVAPLTLRTHNASGDGFWRLHELSLLLGQGVLSQDKYSLIGPLFASPLWLLGQVSKTPQWWVSYFNFVVLAAGIGAIYLLLKDQIDHHLLRVFFLLLVAGSLFTSATFNFYGEMFTTMLFGVGILAVYFGRARAGWVAVVLGVANTPASLLGLGFITLQRIFASGRLRYALIPIATLMVIGTENALRRGSPLNSGYEHGFTYPILFGLLGILFAFGKGLIFFVPGILLPVRSRLLAIKGAGSRLYTVYTLWVAFLIGLVLVYSHWWAWFGGDTWGPRFFLIASLPASLAIAVRLCARGPRLLDNTLTLFALALSLWVGLAGEVFYQDGVAACSQGYDKLVTLCAYTPQDSTLWHIFVSPLAIGKANALLITYTITVFVVLAYPLLRDIGTQTRAGIRAFAQTRGGLWRWRF